MLNLFTLFTSLLLVGTHPTSSKINTGKSTVIWKAEKVTGAHEGKIGLKSGLLSFDANHQLNGGTIEMDMTTITCTDMQGEYGDKLVGHLKSDDFFSVANHPTAKYVIKSVAKGTAANQYIVTGDLTIKGITKSYTFDANVDQSAKVAKTNIKINRTDFDIRYGSKTFFASIGDKAIYDEFSMDLNIVLE